MKPDDFCDFSNAWADAHEVMAAGKVLSENAMVFCFDTLAKYPLDAVLLAIKKHCQLNRYAPTPADICNLLELGNRRLSADEAWAETPQSEQETVCWSAEAAQAYAVVSHLVEEGRMYDAGRAFRSAYERLCNEAELLGKPLTWQVALGYDKEGVQPVLDRAVALGRISQEYATKLLPGPMDGGIIGKLLTGKVVDLPTDNEKLKANWRNIRQSLADANAKMDKKEQLRHQERMDKEDQFEKNRKAAVRLADDALAKLVKAGQ